MQITKRNGSISVYDDQKVVESILHADANVPEELIPSFVAKGIAGEVFDRITKDNDIISTQDVRNAVYEVLCERGYPLTAENYMAYKQQK